MLFLEALILALALSADAFSVAATVALYHRSVREVARLSFHFGLFQGLLAAAGYLLGSVFLSLIESIDHWLAMGILLGIGVRMIWVGLHDHPRGENATNLTRGWHLVGLSLAVSVDALAAGVSLPATRLAPVSTIVLIGIVAALAAVLGMWLADYVKQWAGRQAEILGGIVLILLGIVTPLHHLGIL
jgi:putative Mn2+ efflux pump MntP